MFLYIAGRPRKVQRNRFHASIREDLPPLLDSTMQHDYKVPVLNSNLRGNTTRYGCNVGIVKAAHGAVPTLDKQTLAPMSNHKTWYATDFGRHGERHMHKNKLVGVRLPAINNQVYTKSPVGTETSPTVARSKDRTKHKLAFKDQKTLG